MSEFPTRHGTLWVRHFGSGSARVVALHGFTLHGGMYEQLAGLIGEPLAAPDLPGHGRSRIEPVTMRTAVDAVADLLATVDPPLLLGYSQGGRVALQVALTYPERVGSLVVISTSPGLSGRARQLRQVADDGLAARIEKIGVVRFLDEWLANPLVAPVRADPDLRDADLELRLENKAPGIAAALRGLGQASVSEVTDRLADLPMPVVFIAGALDERYVEFAAAMSIAVGRRPVIVPGVGHNVVLEAPQALADVVSDLLRTR
jgi:2-succinyl-6-hydroxy-2,4-cyclohexadiene-1-carboxylate synthase